jgi:hypothetical protein
MARISLKKHRQHVVHRVCGIRFILKINRNYFRDYLSVLECAVYEVFMVVRTDKKYLQARVCKFLFHVRRMSGSAAKQMLLYRCRLLKL